MKRIALVGDYNESIVAHRAIPIALRMAVTALNVNVRWDWLPTVTLSTSICTYNCNCDNCMSSELD